MHDPGKGIVVIAVNNGEAMKSVAEVAATRGYAFPVAADPRGKVHRQYGVIYRPTTVVVGPDGKVLAVRVGAHTVEQVKEQLRRFQLLP